jgi:hypothetical protein
MRLTSYGPGRFRKKTSRTDDPEIKTTQRLLGWGRSLAMNTSNRILAAAEETPRVDDCREFTGAVAGVGA